MQITGQTGVAGPIASGSPSTPIRQGNLGDVIVSELNGRYFEQSVRGNTFYAVNSAAQALSLTGTTTYTGLTLANPSGSGKNLVMLEAIYALTAGETTALGAIILATGTYVAQTTGNSLGPLSNIIGNGSGSVAKVGASCTYATNPTFLRPFMGFVWATAAGFAFGQYKDEIAGALIIPPGQQVSFIAVTTATTGIGYFSWTEVSSVVL